MTGYPDGNQAAFLAAADKLREAGAEVYSVYEQTEAARRCGGDALVRLGAESADALQRCDVVACLPGSRDALIPDLVLAELYGLSVITVIEPSQHA